jgi:hypothetical protein
MRASAWLGSPPATPQQIAAAEERLKIPLPPSYRAFLQTSNGWGRATHSIERLLAYDRVEWFRKKHRDWISAFSVKPFGPVEPTPDSDYFAYGQHSADFKPAHLKETLQITDVGDAAVYLLNPQVITKAGEWEAWFFANWLPGARRYRSFEELMQSEYHQFAGNDWQPPSGVIGELPDEYIGAPGSSKRRLKKRSPPREPRVLGKAVSRWKFEELLGFLNNPDFDIIHGEVITGLGLLGDPRAIEPLMALVHRSGPMIGAAASALRKLAPERLRERLLELLSQPRSHFDLFQIASHLAEMGEDRAIPVLIEVMKDVRKDWLHQTDYIGKFIAQFRRAGYDALVEQLQNPSATVRRRAAEGLYYTNRPEARRALQALAQDPDPSVREVVKVALDVLPPERKT